MMMGGRDIRGMEKARDEWWREWRAKEYEKEEEGKGSEMRNARR